MGEAGISEAAPAREDVKTGKRFTAARRCWLSGRVDDIFVAQVKRNHRNLFLYFLFFFFFNIMTLF